MWQAKCILLEYGFDMPSDYDSELNDSEFDKLEVQIGQNDDK